MNPAQDKKHSPGEPTPDAQETVAPVEKKFAWNEVVLVALLIMVILQYWSNTRTKSELDELRKVRRQLQNLNLESKNVEKLKSKADEAERLRLENTDLPRLRNEARLYRELKPELDKLRIEVLSLRQLLAKYTNVVAVPSTATVPVPETTTTAPPTPAEDAQKMETEYLAQVGRLRVLAASLHLFAEDNDGLLPRDFSQLASYLEPQMAQNLELSRYEIVAGGRLSDIEDPETTVIVREKKKDKHGIRAYVFADGRVELFKEGE